MRTPHHLAEAPARRTNEQVAAAATGYAIIGKQAREPAREGSGGTAGDADVAGDLPETRPLVEPDRRPTVLGDDDELPHRPVLEGPLPPRMHKRAGQPRPPVALEGHDVLVAGELAESDDAEVGHELVAVEGPEPPPAPGLDEPTLRRSASPLEVQTRVALALRGVAGPDEGGLLPVLVALEGPQGEAGAQRRNAVRCVSGRRDRRRGEGHVDLDVPAPRRPRAGVAARLREGDRPVVRVRERCLEAGRPAVHLAGAGLRRHEHEVAPPEVRVAVGAHDEVITAVGDRRPLEAEQLEVRRQARAVDAHAPIMPRPPHVEWALSLLQRAPA